MRADLAVLWHLHQPDYRDPETGVPCMPWVRLHALRGYRDLTTETVELGARWTLNWAPVLLDQLWEYADGLQDRHLTLTRRPAEELGPAEVAEVRATFVTGHPQMHGGYAHLATAEPTPQCLRDLQVWSTLAWFGASAVAEHPVLLELRAKERGFTEADKALMLAAHDAIVRDLPQRIRAASGCVSTSPYFHPILPLLVDVECARRALPDLPALPPFARPEDARTQLVEARARVEALLGHAPRGLWPSEGSVSPEIVDLVSEAGFSWMATDDGVLARSERSDGGLGPWELSDRLVGLFRSHELSDRIGFAYWARPADEAVTNLLRSLPPRGLVVVALDGENPWESWPDAGAAFRRTLVDRARLVTCDEAATYPPVGRVHRLHTGSWVDGTFRIWIGGDADRQAWAELSKVRGAAAAAESEARARAMPWIHRALGSDWTWWYGEEFDTPFSAEFDAQFRRLVSAAWRALGQEPPASLRRVDAPRTRPSRILCPSLDRDVWIDFWGAGTLPVGGAMARGALTSAHYGWDDEQRLWIRFEVTGRADVYIGEQPARIARHGDVLVAVGKGTHVRVETGGGSFEWTVDATPPRNVASSRP